MLRRMSIVDPLDPKQIQALAEKAGIDKEKLMSIAQSILPHLERKWDDLRGGGDVPLFKDLMAGQKFQAMFASGELDGATATAATSSGVDAETIKKLLPELGKLVAR